MLGRHLPRRAHGSAWPSTTGTVLSATVQMGNSGSVRTEQPLVYYAYQVDGQLFQGHRLRFSGVAWQAAAVVDHCPAGSPVTVFYDPADPSNSTLEL
jgi:hypothetical protein